jgi:hypothetical protein
MLNDGDSYGGVACPWSYASYANVSDEFGDCVCGDALLKAVRGQLHVILMLNLHILPFIY